MRQFQNVLPLGKKINSYSRKICKRVSSRNF